MRYMGQAKVSAYPVEEVHRLVVDAAWRVLGKEHAIHKVTTQLMVDPDIIEQAKQQERPAHILAEQKLRSMMTDYVMASIITSGRGVKRAVSDFLPQLAEGKANTRLRERVIDTLDDRILVYKVATTLAIRSAIETIIKEKKAAGLVEEEKENEIVLTADDGTEISVNTRLGPQGDTFHITIEGLPTLHF